MVTKGFTAASCVHWDVRTQQIDGFATKLQIRPRRNQGLGRFQNFDLHRGVPRATKIIGHEISKLINSRLLEHHIHDIRVVIHVDNSIIVRSQNDSIVPNRMPIRVIRTHANFRGERRDARHNLRVEINAPFEERAIVCRPLVDNIEGPNAIQWAPNEVAQIAAW